MPPPIRAPSVPQDLRRIKPDQASPASHLEAPGCPLRAVQIAQVAVPADADDVDKENAVLERDHLEVDGLDKGPDHVVGGQGGGVVLVELLADGAALEHGHARQEHADEAGGEDALVEGDAGGDGSVGGPEVHVLGQELEPGRGGGAEDGCWGRG